MGQAEDLTAASGPRAALQPALPNEASPRAVPAASAASPRTASQALPGDAASSTSETTVNAQLVAERAVQALFERDMASRMLGMRVVDVKPGYARLAMTVRPDMVNGHRICHGGLIFSFADSTFAAACNSHNESTVAAAASIDFLAPAFEGDQLSAEGHELWRSGRSGLYEITVTNQRGERIALFRGRSHRIGGSLTTERSLTTE